MMTNSPEDLAARLDEILPPGRVDLDSSDADPALRAAVELARDPRPVLSADARARIQAQLLTQADRTFAQRSIVRRRAAFQIRWAAAASLLIMVLAVVLVTTFTHDTTQRPVADQHAPTSAVMQAPSAADSAVFIPQDAIAASLTEIGSGSTSIFIQPLTP